MKRDDLWLKRYVALERKMRTAVAKFLAIGIPTREQLDAHKKLMAKIRSEQTKLHRRLW